MSRFLSSVDHSHSVDIPKQSWVSTMLTQALSAAADPKNLLDVQVTIGRFFLHQKELLSTKTAGEILANMEAGHWDSLAGIYQEIFRLLGVTTDGSVGSVLSSKPDLPNLVHEFEVIVTRCAPNEDPDEVIIFQLWSLCQQFYTCFFGLQEIKSLQEKVVELNTEVGSESVASASADVGAQSGTRPSTQTVTETSVEITEVPGDALAVPAIDTGNQVGDGVVSSVTNESANLVVSDVQISNAPAITADAGANMDVRAATHYARGQTRVGLLASGVIALGGGGFGLGLMLAKKAPAVHHRSMAPVLHPRATSPSPVRAMTPPAVVLPSLPVQSVDQTRHEAGLVNSFSFYPPSIRTGVIGAMVANSDHTRLCLPVGHQTPRDLGVYILGVAHIIGHSPVLLHPQWHIDRAALHQYRLNLSWNPGCDRFTLTLRNGSAIQATTVFGVRDPTFIVTRLNRPVDAALGGALSQ
jgi:hypothetical protein